MKLKSYEKILFAAFAVVFMLFIFMFYFNLYPLKYRAEIISSANEFNVDASLVAGMINAESSFDKTAKSNAGAIGLMQLMPSTARWCSLMLGISFYDEMLYLPKVNIRLGTYYISYLINKFKNVDTAICAYNAGEGVVRSWLNNEKYSNDKNSLLKIPYRETREYLKKVSTSARIYRYIRKV